jgi:hypothetical protein
MQKIKILLLVIPLLALAFPEGGSLDAYGFWCAKWQQNEATFLINPNIVDASVGTDEEEILAHLTGAYDWNNDGASHFDFQYGGTSNIAYVANDQINVLFAVNTNGNGVLATTWCQRQGGSYRGFDIKYHDGDVEWNGPGGVEGNQVDLWAVTAHELGHGLGLDHTDVPLMTLYPYYMLIARDLGWDDIDGVRARYSGQPNVVVNMFPEDYRATYDASGGTWTFDCQAENTTSTSKNKDIWFDVRLPNGAIYGPVIGSYYLHFNGYQTRSASNMSINIPAFAPPGVYVVNMKVGDYPNSVEDEANVGFIKTTASAVSDWEGYDEGITLEFSEEPF